MNERIQQLAHEAGLPTYNPEGIPTKLEKFAELIVRECAEVCDAYGMPDGTSPTAMILSRAIKNKFGVES